MWKTSLCLWICDFFSCLEISKRKKKSHGVCECQKYIFVPVNTWKKHIFVFVNVWKNVLVNTWKKIFLCFKIREKTSFGVWKYMKNIFLFANIWKTTTSFCVCEYLKKTAFCVCESCQHHNQHARQCMHQCVCESACEST